MQAEFQSLKISITDDVHLKAVCDVLGSMGYEKWCFSDKSDFIATSNLGIYSNFDNSADFNDYDDFTLTDLLKMRDKAFKEAIK